MAQSSSPAQPGSQEASEEGVRRRPIPLKPGGGSGGTGRPEDEALSEWTPPSAPDGKPRPRRPATLRPARLHGNRDWLIYIECRPDGVILYPSRLRFPVTSLARGPDNPLLRAVDRMIARRQASVLPGEAPFRPQIRFLVRPESIQGFMLAYPTLETVAAAKTRQNLEPEDDVEKIIAGP